MYERISQSVIKNGHALEFTSRVVNVYHKGDKITGLQISNHSGNKQIAVDYLFSSMPLTQFVLALEPQPQPRVLKAVRKLYYRDHISVNLVVKGSRLFSDNWIYIHAPEVKMARVTNYNNFSKEMPKGKGFSAISVEYFVFQNDVLWKLTDKELFELAKHELEQVKLVTKDSVVSGFVNRETESYPTYYIGYEKDLNCLKDYVESFKNLQMIGRPAMYKYNNMAHSIYSGMLAARNYLAGQKIYNIWSINEDAQYLEEQSGELDRKLG